MDPKDLGVGGNYVYTGNERNDGTYDTTLLGQWAFLGVGPVDAKTRKYFFKKLEQPHGGCIKGWYHIDIIHNAFIRASEKRKLYTVPDFYEFTCAGGGHGIRLPSKAGPIVFWCFRSDKLHWFDSDAEVTMTGRHLSSNDVSTLLMNKLDAACGKLNEEG
jgi:hypothetical protein